MMDIDTSFSLYALLACNAALAAAAAIAILRLQRLLNSRKEFWDSPTGDALKLQDEHAQLLRAIDQRFATLSQGLGCLERGDKDDVPLRHQLPFDNAVRMAKQGASLDDLTRNCGLSENEARLLMCVHRPAANAGLS